MNRRDFVQLLTVAGIGVFSLPGLKKCAMNNTIPEEYDYFRPIRDYVPPPIFVDDLGWSAFLKQWSDSVTTIRLQQILRYGHLIWFDETFCKHLSKRGIDIPIDKLQSGLDYPPIDAVQSRIVEERLTRITETLKKLWASYSPEERVFYGKRYNYEILFNRRQLVYPPATTEQIELAETRLNVSLPPSYKDFLLASNGFLSMNGQLLAVEQIDWLKKRDRETMETWWGEGDIPEDYGDTDEEYMSGYDDLFGANEITRRHYLENCLQVGESIEGGQDSLWLLNPVIQPIQGEWETWTWNPAASEIPRFRNFKEAMEHQYRLDVANEKFLLLDAEAEYRRSQSDSKR